MILRAFALHGYMEQDHRDQENALAAATAAVASASSSARDELPSAAAVASAASALVRYRVDASAASAAAFHAPLSGAAALSVSAVLLAAGGPGGSPPVLLAPAPPGWAPSDPPPRAEALLGCEAAAGGVCAWRVARLSSALDLLGTSPALREALRGLGQPPALWLLLLSLDGAAVAGGSPRWASAAALRPGHRLALSAAPFGALAPTAFLASAAAAVISRTLPAAPPALLLLDLLALPGCEGGPLATPDGLVALLLPPLRGPAAAFPAAVAADALLPALAAHAAAAAPRGAAPPPAPALQPAAAAPAAVPAARLAERAVASLAPGGVAGWGSAVCVAASAGLFLTASHVLLPGGCAGGAAGGGGRSRLPPLPPLAAASATLRGGEGAAQAARALWLCRGPLDLALLQADPPATPGGWAQLRPLADEDHPALQRGAPLLCAGHGALPPGAAGHAPSLSAGAVAHYNARAALLRAHLPVHAGCSGGALLSPDGSLAGLVTSNGRLSVAGGAARLQPFLNWSVAAPALRRLCAAARAVPAGARLAPGEACPPELAAALAELDEADAEAGEAWALREPGKVEAPGPRLGEYLRERRSRL